MNKLAVLSLALLMFGCSSESEFVQTKCGYIEDTALIANFSDGSASRTVSINENSFTFKGTTVKDMKWRADINDLQSIQFTENSELKVTLKSGFSKVIGIVDSKCSLLIKARLKELRVGQ
ncbi:hypothetical protein G3R49_19120 [Shewanella sp. WXL01]|uniref:hypothetical protein n=1 Tax=Shewanella sp. WXL01 TaxID=2709721 RepID=UPI0014384507|nr:hypothetical protein [Shewanella sp. WXL01]NKF52673.1 hypothetical protein [Shewanella sp. WXL01]